MADDIKARKLAAARKKLKEYQAKEKVVGGSKSDHEHAEKLDAQEVRRLESTEVIAPVNMKTSAPPSTDISVASLSKSNASSFDSETASINGTHTQHPQPIENFLPASNDLAHSNTIELLINEKASLCSELAHYKAISKEKSLELEEANIRIQDALKRIEKLEKDLLSGQTQNAQLQANIERLNASAVQSENEVDKLRQENVELRDHVEELKQTLQKGNEQMKVLEDRVKEKECELELNRIRINQISDVASVENDSKVEALTQTKFMHEQQIRDLQAMVQQLETEREQSNQQYQNYVQHLNKEITAFSERNSKLTEENTRLAERERGLVEHVGELEKQLQQIIANQSKQSAVVEQHDSDKKTISEEEVELRTKELLNEKNVLSEKVQVQDAQIADMQRLMDEKLELIQQLEERIENFTSIQSDSTKLLAKVESNSVAASRAVAQNEELKKQLDEVQTKLIQVTNDKVELTNLLDAERYGNREIRANYETMENQLTTITEKLHFKDEEMIRLTKENTELSETIDKLKGISRERVDHDHHNTHNGKHEHGDSCDHSHDHIDGGHDGHDHDHHHEHDHDHHDHDHDHHHDHGSDHHHDHDHSHNHGAEDDHHHSHEHHNHDSCQATKLDRPADQQSSPAIPQSEAMQKLEARFKSLMNDVANLTDEKQRLEHLVLQLQGETDTIGEYIALYQAQRRVLKQREIEKNTQLHKLKSEREELHNKVTLLNQLVNSLSQQVGAQMLNNNISVLDQQQPNERQQLQGSGQEHENVRSTTPSSASEASEGNQIILPNTKQLNSSEIIHAIKNIVADIKNSETNDFDLSVVPTLDHCSCCSGKFETI